MNRNERITIYVSEEEKKHLESETNAEERIEALIAEETENVEEIAADIRDMNARAGAYSVTNFELLKSSYPDARRKEVLETGADDLMVYICREGDTPVYDRAGRPMDDEQKNRFIAKSERYQIISPENRNDLSNDELGKETLRTMEEFTKSQSNVTYVYTVHRDTEHPHAHVAVTGEKSNGTARPREDTFIPCQTPNPGSSTTSGSPVQSDGCLTL